MEKNLEAARSIGKMAETIRKTVGKYISEEECHSDDTQLRINTLTKEVDLADPEDDLPDYDYYPVMDLVRGSDTEPGRWIPDEDAISDVAAEYSGI